MARAVFRANGLGSGVRYETAGRARAVARWCMREPARTTATPLSSRAAADPDTFDARWKRSAANNTSNDQIPNERTISVLIVIASIAAIAAAWWLVL